MQKPGGHYNVIYIADAKLVTEPNLRLMHKHQLRFISRVPDNFCGKLAARVKKEAYAEGTWQDLGSIHDDKKHARYQGISHTQYFGREKMRLLVVKSNVRQEVFWTRLEKERKELERLIQNIQKQEFACEPDARQAAEQLKKQKSRGFFTLSYTLCPIKTTKRPVGNPGKTPKPSVEIVTWRVQYEFTEHASAIASSKEQAESFVLVTNIPVEELEDRALLLRYKEQHVVETGFRWLRQPSMAATIFLKRPERMKRL